MAIFRYAIVDTSIFEVIFADDFDETYDPIPTYGANAIKIESATAQVGWVYDHVNMPSLYPALSQGDQSNYVQSLYSNAQNEGRTYGDISFPSYYVRDLTQYYVAAKNQEPTDEFIIKNAFTGQISQVQASSAIEIFEDLFAYSQASDKAWKTMNDFIWNDTGYKTYGIIKETFLGMLTSELPSVNQLPDIRELIAAIENNGTPIAGQIKTVRTQNPQDHGRWHVCPDPSNAPRKYKQAEYPELFAAMGTRMNAGVTGIDNLTEFGGPVTQLGDTYDDYWDFVFVGSHVPQEP